MAETPRGRGGYFRRARGDGGAAFGDARRGRRTIGMGPRLRAEHAPPPKAHLHAAVARPFVRRVGFAQLRTHHPRGGT